MKTWKTWRRNGYTVVMRDFDGDLKVFDIIGDDDETIGTIYPSTIVDMLSIIIDLDNGLDVDGWEDGSGNTIRVR